MLACKNLQPQRIVLPEALDARILVAAAEVASRGLAHPILLGDPDAVHTRARQLRCDISKVRAAFSLKCLSYRQRRQNWHHCPLNHWLRM